VYSIYGGYSGLVSDNIRVTPWDEVQGTGSLTIGFGIPPTRRHDVRHESMHALPRASRSEAGSCVQSRKKRN
jgi:hypothetical protein